MTEHLSESETTAAAALPGRALPESDNTFVKTFLLLQNAVRTAPAVSRSLWRYYGKSRLARLSRRVKETPPHPLV